MRSCWEKEPINQSKKVLSINVYLLMCQRMHLFIIHVLVYTLKWKVWGVLISTPVISTFWMQGIFQALYALVLLICMFCKFLGVFFANIHLIILIWNTSKKQIQNILNSIKLVIEQDSTQKSTIENDTISYYTIIRLPGIRYHQIIVSYIFKQLQIKFISLLYRKPWYLLIFWQFTILIII